ncbi:hypothetical protein ACFV4N_01650 [Actinosynnema sp. NPDC059797]
MTDDSLAVLNAAAAAAGLDATGAEVLRLGEDDLYRLPSGVVARGGQVRAAAKEVRVARWLEDNDVSAVRVLRGLEQPVVVDGRPVTFWHDADQAAHRFACLRGRRGPRPWSGWHAVP